MKARPQPDPECPSCVVLGDRLDVVAKLGAELTRLKDRKPKTSRTSSDAPVREAPALQEGKQRFVADSHGIEISLRAISNLEGRVSEAPGGAHAEALASIAATSALLGRWIWG